MKLYYQSMNHLLAYNQNQKPKPVDPFSDPVGPVEAFQVPKEDSEDNFAITVLTSLSCPVKKVLMNQVHLDTI